MIDWVERENDPELKALLQPLFVERRLVVWSADFHVAPVTDLKSLLTPLGVEFIDLSLSPHCNLVCNCDAKKRLKVIRQGNVLNIQEENFRLFYDAYYNDTEFARVDAFFVAYPMSTFENYMPFNRSIIALAATRYENARFITRTWTRMNHRLRTLAANPLNVVAANSLYELEYVRYFSGVQSVYLQSFCAYTQVYYSPSPDRQTYLLSALRGELDGDAAEFGAMWRREFNLSYTRRGASFVLETLRKRYQGVYSYADLVSHLGIVYVPYQISYMSIYEQYRMHIPLFFPSLELLTKWQHTYWIMTERTWDGVGRKRPHGSYQKPYQQRHSQQHDGAIITQAPDPNNEWDEEAIKHWLAYSDFYTLPHFVLYKSVDDLVQILEEKTEQELRETSERMRKYSRGVLAELLRFWRAQLLRIAQASTNRPH